MFSHFYSGMLRGCSNPAVFCLGAFTCWHTRHLLTYSAIFFFILLHHKCYFKSWYIFVPPGCIEKGELCASVRISFFISLTGGTHKCPWHNSPSSVDLEKPSTGHVFNWFRILFRLGSSRCEWVYDPLSERGTHCQSGYLSCHLFRYYRYVSSFEISSHSLLPRDEADECTAFRLSASATMFAFPGWYWISMS